MSNEDPNIVAIRDEVAKMLPAGRMAWLANRTGTKPPGMPIELMPPEHRAMMDPNFVMYPDANAPCCMQPDPRMKR